MILRRNVLIIHTGALGDFVLTWPLTLALGRLYPQSRIICVTHGQKGKLAEKVLGVESTDIEGGWHHLFDAQPRLPKPSLMLATGAHSIISFVPDMKLAAVAPAATIYPLRAAMDGAFSGHASEYVLEQLRSIPAVYSGTQQMLRVIATRGIGARSTRGRAVVIHPGSGAREKCWPVENFAALIDRLRHVAHEVRIVLGEVEAERWDAKDVRLLEERAVIVRPADYLELHEQLASAAMVLANDSGPGHLAGIIGTPTVSLFGPTSPEQWKPLGPHVKVIQGQPIDAIAVDDVYGMIVQCLKS